MVGFCFDGLMKTYSVHKIVAKVFHGDPIEPRMQVDHIDNDPANYHPSNLRYVTASENVQKAYDMGKKDHSGFKASSSKYTEDQFERVLSMIERDFTNKQIVLWTGVGNGTVKNLRNGTHFFVRKSSDG